MPNWCNNTLEITHADPAMIERVRKAFNEGALLNEFVPVPEDLRITAGSDGPKGSPEQNLLEAKEVANRKKHGYANWYDYCVGEWGTKWDVGGDGAEAQDIPNGLLMSFDSAWSPPVNAYEKMVEMGFSIRAMYYEPGMAFAGVWEDGSDEFYEYGGLTSEQIREELPEVLDEAFGISESAEMWEEENEEEQE